MRVLIDALGGAASELREVVDAFRKVKLSTAFSGIAAPEVAARAMGTTLAQYASDAGVHADYDYMIP